MTTTTSQCIITMPITSGLLTTVEQLPSKYKIRYLARKTMIDSPLDLTVKLQNPETANTNNNITNLIPTNNNISTNCSNNNNNNNNNSNPSPITPPPSPPKKRYRNNENFTNFIDNDNIKKMPKLINSNNQNNNDDNNHIKLENSLIISKEMITPPKQLIRINTAPKTLKSQLNNLPNKEKKSKAIRKLKFDEETSSPVSGTIIRPIEEILNNIDEHQSGDIDPQYNIVEITDEAKLELAAIKNVIGAYVCKLCRLEFDDAFGLAQHRCSCIVLLEYRCPECGKRFNCPANLASHRRWHKPKEEVLRKQQENQENELQFQCQECNKQFKRQAYLRKHLLTHKERDIGLNDKKEKLLLKRNQNNNKKIKLDLIDNNNSNNSRNDYISNTNSINSIGEDCNSSSSSVTSIYHHEPSNESNDITDYNNRQLYKYDSDIESRSSDCSSPGRLQIIENNLTEEENIAAAALAHLRNGPSVIQHTHATMAF